MKSLTRKRIYNKEFIAHIELTPQLIDFSVDVTLAVVVDKLSCAF